MNRAHEALGVARTRLGPPSGVRILGELPRGQGLREAVHANFSAALHPLVKCLVAVRLSANAITTASLFMGAAAGIAVASNRFGIAAIATIAASVGDALDGLVARYTRTSSVGGALLDASVDRYEEFFVLSGMALFFHSSPARLTLVLLALAGSFMVSYGSAKAEAFDVSVPPGLMRRPERAVCLCVGMALVPLAGALERRSVLPIGVEYVPILLALGLIGVIGNVSAVRRLRAVATIVSRRGGVRPSAG